MSFSGHIAIVLGSLRMGGAEKVLIRLANGFSKSRIKCTIVVLNDGGPLRKSISPDINVVSLNVPRARKGVKPFSAFLKNINPDVIIVSQTHIQIMSLVAVSRINWKGKVILNEHSLFSPNTIKTNKLLAKFYFSRADAVTAVSESVAEDFKNNFKSLAGKTSVIYNAAYDESILLLREEIQEWHDTIPVILTAGRLVASKNNKLLIDAFKLVLGKVRCRLVFLGDGDQRKNLIEHAARKMVVANISFEGMVENPYRYMKNSDVFVLCSAYEGLPTVLIEALACGCNIVCTDSDGGAKEILDNGKFGKLVPPNDPIALCEAIVSSISRKEDADAKLVRAKQFGVDNAVINYLTLINKLMGEKA